MNNITSIFLIIFFLASGHISWAQKSIKSPAKSKQTPIATTPTQQVEGTLFFEKTYLDIGNLVDNEEPTKVTFKFKNIGKSPITILQVKPDCNCSKPQWEKRAYAQNESGEIVTYFYPRGIDGDVVKNLTVFTNGTPEVYYLSIRVSVDGKNARVAKMYPQKQGQVKFDSYEVKFAKLYTYSVDSMFRVMYNPTTKPIKILQIKSPDNITAVPDGNIIHPENGMTFKFKYFASKAKDYGAKLDEVIVITNDSIEPVKKFLVRATIEEDFSKLTPKELKNRPIFAAVTPVVNLDTVNIKSINTAVFTITNKGKSPMYIRKVYGTCGCTTIEYDTNQAIKKGKKATIKVTYSTNYDLGEVEKQIYVITNTPDKALNELVLKANVMYQKK